MYSTCLFCQASLGANQSIEHFPVGRRLAFDAERGRLWAVCTNCARWNLTPLEQRWEAIEQCERAYRETRQRVSTDNIALARLRDGTDLVRIGRPQLPEYSAWRYGEQLGRRRKRYLVKSFGGGTLTLTHLAASATVCAAAATQGPWLPYVFVGGLAASIASARLSALPLVHLHLPGEQRVALDAFDASEGRLSFDEKDTLTFTLVGRVKRRLGPAFMPSIKRKTKLELSGDAARRALSEAIVAVNHTGARPNEVSAAVREIESGTDAAQMIRRVANHAWLDSDYYRGLLSRQSPESLLALEMLLHEDDERRAMAGELGALYTRWQEAERVAKIADGELTELPVRDGEPVSDRV